ncbi:hypothetical protein O3P69_014845 [Scylla paramamosain]|uniref:Ionotropic glutamate receptor C-terminal domain-containing protein n=1 Tax=Scylla paramamosain TaxID=85552 RepID=A0AAW0TZS8_SCYPA
MPTGGCARLAVGMWLLIALILGTVYRSNLKALLIIPKLELPFDSMEDLINAEAGGYKDRDFNRHSCYPWPSEEIPVPDVEGKRRGKPPGYG